MSDSVTPYPFDVAQLSKGDWLPPERCERVIGVSRNDVKKYQLKLLGVKQALERQWHRERDEVITTSIERDGIRICTDDGAVVTNEKRFEQSRRMMRHALVRSNGIDRSALSSDEMRSKHERSLTRLAAFISGGTRAAFAALKGHRRATPGLKT